MLNTIQSIIDKDKSINFYMGPLIASECDYNMNTKKVLEFGSLPEIYSGHDEKENIRILKSYSANYIKEEIKAEALVRNLESFTRFFSGHPRWTSDLLFSL